MSVELAKAFCVRLMSDDEFRDAIGRATSAKEIADLVAANRKISILQKNRISISSIPLMDVVL